jgi:hypothetical protein
MWAEDSGVGLDFYKFLNVARLAGLKDQEAAVMWATYRLPQEFRQYIGVARAKRPPKRKMKTERANQLLKELFEEFSL